MKKLIFTLIFLIISIPLFAGAWTMAKGHSYTRISMNYYYAHEEFADGGHREDFPWNGKYKDYNVGVYEEYGITDRITVLTSFYYKKIQKEDDFVKETTYGFSDIDLGLKVNILKGKKGVFSVQGLIKIPEAYDKHDTLPLGNGQYDFELRGLMGISLWPYIPGYMNLELGYRWRNNAPADELRYLIEFGTNITKNFYGRIKLDGILGMRNGKVQKDLSGNPTLSYNYDLGKLDITFGYKITKIISLEFEYTPEIYGKNTSAGATYTFAICITY